MTKWLAFVYNFNDIAFSSFMVASYMSSAETCMGQNVD